MTTRTGQRHDNLTPPFITGLTYVGGLHDKLAENVYAVELHFVTDGGDPVDVSIADYWLFDINDPVTWYDGGYSCGFKLSYTAAANVHQRLTMFNAIRDAYIAAVTGL